MTNLQFKVDRDVTTDMYSFRKNVWHDAGGDFLINPTKEKVLKQIKAGDPSAVVTFQETSKETAGTNMKVGDTVKAKRRVKVMETVEDSSPSEYYLNKGEGYQATGDRWISQICKDADGLYVSDGTFYRYYDSMAELEKDWEKVVANAEATADDGFKTVAPKIEKALKKIAKELGLPAPRWKKERGGDGRVACELKYSPTAMTDLARKVVVHFELDVWCSQENGKYKYSLDFRYFHKILAQKERLVLYYPRDTWDVSSTKILEVLDGFADVFMGQLKKNGYSKFEGGIAVKA